MPMSFAGVFVMAPRPADAGLVDFMYRPDEMVEFDRPTAPQHGQGHISFASGPMDRFRLNVLRWPVGASDWATFHFLCSENQLARIRQVVYGGGGYGAATLVLDDEKNQIHAPMWMLPPRHIAQIDGLNDLLLVTLVDDRYWWWERSGNVTVTAGTTTWANLYSQIATALSITITPDTVASAYLTPSADWASAYQDLPTLLDAAAASCGQRVVRSLSGAVKTQNATTALASLNQQAQAAATTYKVQAGGGMAFRPSPSQPCDLAAAVPNSITVTFPAASNGTPTNVAYAITVTLASLALPEFQGVRTGYPASAVYRCNTVANYTGGGLPANQAQLLALAKQIATDAYRWRLGRLDARFTRVVPWQPEGFDTIEWTWHAAAMNTAVRRGPYRDNLELIGVNGTYGATALVSSAFGGGGGGNGSTPIFRVTSGEFQVSTDGGTTWTSIFPLSMLSDGCGPCCAPAPVDIVHSPYEEEWQAEFGPQTLWLDSTSPRYAEFVDLPRPRIRFEDGELFFDDGEWERKIELSPTHALIVTDSPVASGSDYISSGSSSWTAPAGVTNVAVDAFGPGGNGSLYAGGGGARTYNASVAVTPSNSYSYVIGAGGSDTNTTFTGDATTVTAGAGGNGGFTGPTGGGAGTYGGGQGPVAGGSTGQSSGGGAGGGASGGIVAAGGNGVSPPFDQGTGSGGAGGTAPVGGFAGGNGGMAGPAGNANDSSSYVYPPAGTNSANGRNGTGLGAGGGGWAPVAGSPSGGTGGNGGILLSWGGFPTVRAISPTTGAATTSITITGTNFTGVAGVYFGGTPAASYSVSSSTSITASAPSGSGTVDVTVATSAGTTAVWPVDQFTYTPVPTVTGISPSSGPPTLNATVDIVASGGSISSVSLHTPGYGYLPNFGGGSLIQLIPTGATGGLPTLGITTSAAGVPLTVAETNGGGSMSSGTNVATTSGACGTEVVITGTGFTYATGVSFGGNAATFTVNSDTEIVTTSPNGTAGTVDITVTTSAGTSSTSSADQFTYVGAPTVTAVSPSVGTTSGGMSVTITGTNFVGVSAVMFGSSAATGYTVTSGTSITATSPAESAGTVDVTVTAAGGISATSSSDHFTYQGAPTVTGVSPTAGPTAGSTSVSITGTNFTGATAVKFGTTNASSYTVNSSTSITATSPSGSAGTVDITVTTPIGTSATSSSDQFHYTTSQTFTSSGTFTTSASTTSVQVQCWSPGVAGSVGGSGFGGAGGAGGYYGIATSIAVTPSTAYSVAFTGTSVSFTGDSATITVSTTGTSGASTSYSPGAGGGVLGPVGGGGGSSAGTGANGNPGASSSGPGGGAGGPAPTGGGAGGTGGSVGGPFPINGTDGSFPGGGGGGGGTSGPTLGIAGAGGGGQVIITW